jgi:hypothetical protein
MSRHTPRKRKRGIQYAAALPFHRWRLGILDRPLSRAMTTGNRGAFVLDELPIQFSNSQNIFRRDSAFPRRDAPESCMKDSPGKTEGVGNAGCPMHPQPRVQK